MFTISQIKKIAEKEAYKALKNNEVPVGAVIVNSYSTIVFSCSNSVYLDSCHSCHAEMKAIQQVCRTQHTVNLTNYFLYSTLEPCLMCFGLINHCRINFAFGAKCEKFGFSSKYALSSTKGCFIGDSYSGKLLRPFFQQLRKTK